MRVASPHAQSWQDSLEALNTARNAIAHANQDDLDRLARDGYPIVLETIKRWHRKLDLLAGTMDDVVADYLDGLLRTGRPW
jgi:hypothetical protein